MATHEKPAERGHDGLSQCVRLAAEHHKDSPKDLDNQRRAFAYRGQACDLRGASQHAALSLAAHFHQIAGGTQ